MQIDIEFAFYLTNTAGNLWIWGTGSGKIHSPCSYRVGEWVDFPEFGNEFMHDEDGGDPFLMKIVKIEHARVIFDKGTRLTGPEIKSHPLAFGLWERRVKDFERGRKTLIEEVVPELLKSKFECSVDEDRVAKPTPDTDPIRIPYTTMI